MLPAPSLIGLIGATRLSDLNSVVDIKSVGARVPPAGVVRPIRKHLCPRAHKSVTRDVHRMLSSSSSRVYKTTNGGCGGGNKKKHNNHNKRYQVAAAMQHNSFQPLPRARVRFTLKIYIDPYSCAPLIEEGALQKTKIDAM